MSHTHRCPVETCNAKTKMSCAYEHESEELTLCELHEDYRQCDSCGEYFEMLNNADYCEVCADNAMTEDEAHPRRPV